MDTIEIEPYMVEAAHSFGDRVRQAYDDPRSHIFYDDAKTYFSSMQPHYDILIAEPSNPWVSGVSSLFTQEFYKTVNRHLNPDGLFVQWLQLYETQLPIVASVMKAIDNNFSYYTVYVSAQSDMLVIASRSPIHQTGQRNIFSNVGMQKELGRLGIFTSNDLDLRMVGTKYSLAPLFASYNVQVNSDYFPILDTYAPQARFMASNTNELAMLRLAHLPLIEMLDTNVAELSEKGSGVALINDMPSPDIRVTYRQLALKIRDYYMGKRLSLMDSSPDYPQGINRDVLLVKLLAKECRMADDWAQWKPAFMNVMGILVAQLSPTEVDNIWDRLNLDNCSVRLSQNQRRWHTLAKAVGLRRPDMMIATAEAILKDDDSTLADYDRRYVVNAAALGYLAMGYKKNTTELLDRYRQTVESAESPLDILTARYFRAHASTHPATVHIAGGETSE